MTITNGHAEQVISLTSDTTFVKLIHAISAFPNLRITFHYPGSWQARIDAIYGKGICWYEAVGEASNPNAALVELGHKLINAFVSFKRPGYQGTWYAKWHDDAWMFIQEQDVEEVASHWPDWREVRAPFQWPGYEWPGA